MKLPGIQYGTAVPSFGQRDVTAGLRVANAWTNAANAWSKAIDDVLEVNSDAEASAATAQARQELDDAELQMRRGTWNATELGQPPEALKIKTRDRLGDQEVYQTHEFAGDYYDYRAKEIAEKYSAGLSKRAKQKFAQKFADHAMRRRVQVREDQFKRGEVYGQGTLDHANNLIVQGVKWNSRHDAIEQIEENILVGMNRGYFDYAEAQKRMQSYREDVYYQAAVEMISDDSIESTADLDNMAVLIDAELGNLGAEKSMRLSTLLERRRTRIEARVEREDRKARENVDVENLYRLYQGEDARTIINSNRAAGTPTGTVRLMGHAYTRGDTSSRYDDPEAKDNIASLIAEAPFSANPSESYDLIERMLLSIGSQANPTLSPSTIQGFQNQLLNLRQAPFKTEEYATVSNQMRMEITGTTDTFSGFLGGTEVLRFNDAENDLRAYIRRMGPDADIEKWWSENRTMYTEELWTDRKISQSGIPRTYVETDADGALMSEATEKRLDDALASGELEEARYDEHMKKLRQLRRLLGED